MEWDEHEIAKTETLKVGQLIQFLSKYPKEMKVLFTWEGSVQSVDKKNIYQDVLGCLLLDADENFYKGDFAKDPNENED